MSAINLLPSDSAIHRAYVDILNAVTWCCGDSPENRAWYEEWMRYDPTTIPGKSWLDLMLVCGKGNPEAQPRLVAAVKSLVNLLQECRCKPVTSTVTPTMPKMKISEGTSRQSVDVAFASHDWQPQGTDYSDGFGSLIGRRSGPGSG
jgi:hypothetical protein